MPRHLRNPISNSLIPRCSLLCQYPIARPSGHETVNQDARSSGDMSNNCRPIKGIESTLQVPRTSKSHEWLRYQARLHASVASESSWTSREPVATSGCVCTAVQADTNKHLSGGCHCQRSVTLDIGRDIRMLPYAGRPISSLVIHPLSPLA